MLIRYTGTHLSKAGRVFKGFEVFVAGDDARIEPIDVPRPAFHP